MTAQHSFLSQAFGWGGIVIPYIRMKVLVEFSETDPDNPLATGCAHNGENKVPYDLPANRPNSAFRGDTQQGQGFRQISFDDQTRARREEVLVRFSHDLTVNVDSHATAHITRKDIPSVIRPQLTQVERQQSVNIRADYAISAGTAPERDAIQANEQHRKRARSFSTFGLINTLEQGKAQGKAGKIAKMLVKTDVLVLHELRYLPFSTSGGAMCRRENSLTYYFLILLYPPSQQVL